MAQTEIKDLPADAAPLTTDVLMKQAAAGGVGNDKKVTIADLVDAAPPKAHTASHTDGSDDIQDATAAQKGVATAAQITKLDAIAALADVTGANAPQAHAASHTDGSDDIQSATAGQKGLATAAQITKLDAIAALADVTGDNPPQAHTVASHSDTTATGAELDALTDASNADALHAHAHDQLSGIAFDDHKTVNTTSTTDGVAKTIETIAIPDNTVVEIVAEIVGRRTDAADRIGGVVRATVYREAAAGVVVEGVSKDFSASDGQFDLNIVGSGNDALIQVTGRTGRTMNWRAVSKTNSVA